ncbi:HNH endonuclease signature motif containing protein [Paludisphaera sp.]|uniref:HNH endonuclease signature motif containing protein n=1 Tax=Paludisphaera sp. TaxID=2017432 RepID=UPI00301C49DC
MSRPPTRRSGPPPERTYKPKPLPQESGPRQPRLYDRRDWRGSGRRLGAKNLKLRTNPLCERCLMFGEYVPAVDVHHKTDVADAPELAFDQANLEALCKQCHGRESNRRQRHGSQGPQP